uniref:DUF2750 domain-containing protein n=1 Tax=Paenibacillus sp. Y5S-9 TaxID=3122489 RepID=UPI00403EFC46
MNQKEFESVINLPANIRYEYFIKKVVDSEEVWGLYENGGQLLKMIKVINYFHFGLRKNSRNTVQLMVGFKPSIFLNNADSAVLEVDILIEDLKTELEKY